MTIHSLSGYGTSTTTGTGSAVIAYGMLAYGTSTTTGYAYAVVLQDLLVTQAGGQVDAYGSALVLTQLGANVDATHSEPRLVTQVALNTELHHDEPRIVTQAAANVDGSATPPFRATQAGLMVDARRRRPILTTKLLEFHVYDRNGNYLEFLDNAYDKSYYAELNETGGGQFKLPMSDAKAAAANLTVNNIVKVRYCNTDVGAFFIENIDKPIVADPQEKVYSVSGRGLLAGLEDGVIYPTDINDSTTTTRSYASATCGSVFLDLYAEFEARGGGDLGTDFSATLDSAGESWTDSQTEDYGAGQTMLDVARHHASLGIEITVSPDKTLHYWKSAGSDKSSSVLFAEGLNITRCTVHTEGQDLANAVLGEGQDVLVETTDADSITSYGRREMYLAGRNTSASAQLTAANSALLTDVADPVDAVDMEVSCDALRPFIDYALGDTVLVNVPDQIDKQEYRVRAIAIVEGNNPQDVRASLRVNSTRLEYLTKLHRSVELARQVPTNASASLSLSQADTRRLTYAGHTHTESDITDLDHDAVKLQGRAIGTAAPSDTQVLAWNAGASEWAPANASGASGSTISMQEVDGDPSIGTVTAIIVPNDSLSASGGTATLSWAGTAHASQHENGGADEISVAGLSGVLADRQDANKLLGRTIGTAAPSDGQILTWDDGASEWTPDDDTGFANPMSAAGDIIYGGAAGAATRLAAGSAGQVLKVATGGTTLEWAAESAGGASTRDGIIGFTIDGGGTTVTTGVKGYVPVPSAGTVTAWRVVADQAGDVVVDIWKDTFANFPPTDYDSITGSDLPTLSGAQTGDSTALTGWTTALAANDWLAFNVDSVGTVTRAVVALFVTYGA